MLAEPPYESDRDFEQQLIALNDELAALARERHRAVAAEQRARRNAEQATRTKDEALAVIAHELRQPLTAATMALAVLEQRPEALERVRGVLGRQLSYMTRLVDDLLDASNVMRGTIRLQKQRFDLRTVVQDGFELLEPQMLQRQQQPSLSLMPEPIYITADPTRVRQVFSNVLTNASKFTPSGGTIRVSVDRDDASAVVRVRDTGKGIAADALDSLFGLFVRGTTDTAGLGIGLAVAKRLVELHGGSIEGRSEGPGFGSEFVMRWPLAD